MPRLENRLTSARCITRCGDAMGSADTVAVSFWVRGSGRLTVVEVNCTSPVAVSASGARALAMFTVRSVTGAVVTATV